MFHFKNSIANILYVKLMDLKGYFISLIIKKQQFQYKLKNTIKILTSTRKQHKNYITTKRTRNAILILTEKKEEGKDEYIFSNTQNSIFNGKKRKHKETATWSED